MDPLCSSDHSHARIWDMFHRQLDQHGHELSSFVSTELGEPPSGLSITLETIEWPESLVNWKWFVGSADPAVERSVLRFFQTDVGKRALSADGVEFKLASALLRLPSNQPDDFLTCPAGFTPAAAPLQDGQSVVIVPQPASTNLPHSHICIPATTGGWLQVSPRTHLEQLSVAKPQDQQAGIEVSALLIMEPSLLTKRTRGRPKVPGRMGREHQQLRSVWACCCHCWESGIFGGTTRVEDRLREKAPGHRCVRDGKVRSPTEWVNQIRASCWIQRTPRASLVFRPPQKTPPNPEN